MVLSVAACLLYLVAPSLVEAVDCSAPGVDTQKCCASNPPNNPICKTTLGGGGGGTADSTDTQTQSSNNGLKDIGNNGGAFGNTKCNPNNPSGTDCLKKNPITKDLNTIINYLTGLAGVVIVGVIIVGGIQYMLAGDNSQGTAAAKQRITHAIIALVFFSIAWSILQFIVPGGAFN